MKELINRFKAELPAFWVKVRNLAIGVATSAILLIQANIELDLELSSDFIQWCKYVIAASIAISGSAQFTKK